MTNTNEPAKDNTRQYVVFTLDGTDYAIPVANVVEATRPLDVTALPNLPDWALGISNFHGDIVSVVDLRRFLGMASSDNLRSGRLLIVRSLREDIQVGLVVDDVTEVADLPEVTEVSDMESHEPVAQFVRGVMERQGNVLILLDPERLMLSPTLRQFETAASS